MNVLFTGFDIFGPHDFNPSSVAAESAAAAASATYELLTVSFEDARRFAAGVADYDLILHLGLAARTNWVRLERYAHNIRMVSDDAAREDAPDAVRKLTRGPVAFETNVDLRALREGLVDRWDVRPSRDAGTYVCNATYYHSLAAAASSGTGVVFIHVPMWDRETAESFGRDLGELVVESAERL